MKRCPQCNCNLPESAFGLDNGRPDKLNPWCKECKNRKGRERYASDPEYRAAKTAYRVEYRNELLADPERYEQQLEAQRQWYQEHWADSDWREKENARHRESYANWTPEQRERKRQATKAWQERNREHYNKQHREYMMHRYHTDPEFKKNLQDWFTRRRNIKRGNGGSYTQQEWDDLCLMAGYRCVRCGEIKALTVDHIIPVSLGGGSEITNLQPLCDSCNKSKGPTEFDYRSLTLAACVEPIISERGVKSW